MKNDIVQSAQSAFAITFTSANPNEYPVIYAEDQWHTANKSDKICQLYDKLHTGSNTSATGAQFTQREINETLANTVDASNSSINSSISELNKTVNTLNSKVSSLESGIVNVYRYKGSVNTVNDLQALNNTSKAGDVYNVLSTGMNYAFVGISECLYCVDNIYTGIKLLEYAKARRLGTKTEQLLVNGHETSCTVAATQDEDGNYLIYAYVGNSAAAGQYLDLSTYDSKNGYQTSQSEGYLLVPSEKDIWDALGESQSLTLWEE